MPAAQPPLPPTLCGRPPALPPFKLDNFKEKGRKKTRGANVLDEEDSAPAVHSVGPPAGQVQPVDLLGHLGVPSPSRWPAPGAARAAASCGPAAPGGSAGGVGGAGAPLLGPWRRLWPPAGGGWPPAGQQGTARLNPGRAGPGPRPQPPAAGVGAPAGRRPNFRTGGRRGEDSCRRAAPRGAAVPPGASRWPRPSEGRWRSARSSAPALEPPAGEGGGAQPPPRKVIRSPSRGSPSPGAGRGETSLAAGASSEEPEGRVQPPNGKGEVVRPGSARWEVSGGQRSNAGRVARV